MAKTARPKPLSGPDTGLVGKFFVTFLPTKSEPLNRQGIVRAKVEEGVYLVQVCDWIMGEPQELFLIPIETMLGNKANPRWMFFEDAEHLKFWFDQRPEGRPGQKNG